MNGYGRATPLEVLGDQRVRFEDVMYASTWSEICSSDVPLLVPFAAVLLGANWAKAGCERADCEMWRVQDEV